MSSQDRPQQRRVERDDVEDEVIATTDTSTAALDSDVDAFLDEIDSVLEENAEDFVKSFVQKGGQ